jgi:hypothetical protein
MSGYAVNFGVTKRTVSGYTELYGHTSYTIENVGSELAAYCMMENNLGLSSPGISGLNSYLKTQADGFFNPININPFAVLRELYQRTGSRCVFRGNVPLNEALERGLSVGAYLKYPEDLTEHMVYVLCFYANGSPLPNYYVYDPYKADPVIRASYEQPYNTRSFYLLYRKPTNGVSWGLTGLAALSNDPDVTLTVTNSDGQNVGENVSGATIVSGCPGGDYNVSVSGPIGRAYQITTYSYDESGNATANLYSGIIGETNNHPVPVVSMPTLSKINLLGLHADNRIAFYDLVVTAVVPGGFYVQGLDDRIPLFVQSTTVPTLHSKVSYLEGIIDSDGKSLQATQSQFINLCYADSLNPVGVTAAKASSTMGFFTKTFGKVTQLYSDGFELDNCLYVVSDNPVAVGDMWAVNGVYHQGKFYAPLYSHSGFHYCSCQQLL